MRTGRIVCCLWLLATAAGAQPATATAPKTAEAQPAQDSLGRATPRGTVLGFLTAARKGDNAAAALYLNTKLRQDAAETLAQQLFVVLDTRLPARLTQLSDAPDGPLADTLRPNLDQIGVVALDDGDLPIVLERVNRGPSGWMWLFSRKTLDAIPDAYEEVGRVSLEAILPSFFVNTRIAGVRLFEWLALLVGALLLYVSTVLLHRLVRPWFPRLLPFPVRLLLLAAGIHWTLSAIGLPLLARQFWSAMALVLTAVATVWLLVLLNAKTERLIVRRLIGANVATASSLARVARRAIDVLLVIAGALLTLSAFGVNPAPALAGLGVGGIAVALAAQKTLENVVAGVSLIFDHALRVGDTLKIGGISGTVDYIGLRSTRIRTLDRTVVNVPNGQMATMTLETLSARDKFWFHPLLGLQRQTTASQLRTVLDGTRRLLVDHDLVDRESIRVRLGTLGAGSLDVDVFAYVIARDWNHFLEIQEGLLFDLLEIVRLAGTALALPQPVMMGAGPSS